MPTKKADRTHADYGFVHFEERQAAVTLVEAAERAQDPLILKFPEGTENILQVGSPPGCMKSSCQGLCRVLCQCYGSLWPLLKFAVEAACQQAALLKAAAIAGLSTSPPSHAGLSTSPPSHAPSACYLVLV